MVLSKEGGESSLTYGASDGTFTASPESSVWTTEGSACKKAGKSGRAGLPRPQPPGAKPRTTPPLLWSPEYVSGQEDSLKISKSQVSPQVWDGGKVGPCINVIPWQDKGLSHFPRTVRKMVWTPTGPSPPSTPSTWDLSGSVAGGEPGRIGWERQGPLLPCLDLGCSGIGQGCHACSLVTQRTAAQSASSAGSKPSRHPLRNLRLTFPLSTHSPAQPALAPPHLLLPQLPAKPAWTPTLTPEPFPHLSGPLSQAPLPTLFHSCLPPGLLPLNSFLPSTPQPWELPGLGDLANASVGADQDSQAGLKTG